MRSFDVVIVGAGHAGAQLAVALRQRKFAGTVAMISDEAYPPYERPPLSKDYLFGDKLFERMLIRPESFWSEREVSLLLERRVVAVDPALHRVVLMDGEEIGYGSLVWATGGSPRRLTCSGHDLTGVHSIRTRADVDRMIAELPAVERVGVIGGGYIGLEAAAALTKLGKQVVVLEAQDRLLARVTGHEISRFYERKHRAEGVDVRLGVAVNCIEERDGAASGVRLDGGEVLPCDLVVVGIGIVPAVAPLIEAGADGGNGVVVDGQCRTSIPDVFAIGDCALHENAFANGAAIRLESVQNANDQALTVAKVLTGAPEDYHAVPWFWSQQYGLMLQTVGLSASYDQTVVRGSVGSESFSVVYLREGRVIALDCVNATRDYVQGKLLVKDFVAADPVLLADLDVPLKQLAAAAPIETGAN